MEEVQEVEEVAIVNPSLLIPLSSISLAVCAGRGDRTGPHANRAAPRRARGSGPPATHLLHRSCWSAKYDVSPPKCEGTLRSLGFHVILFLNIRCDERFGKLGQRLQQTGVRDTGGVQRSVLHLLHPLNTAAVGFVTNAAGLCADGLLGPLLVLWPFANTSSSFRYLFIVSILCFWMFINWLSFHVFCM